MSERRFNQAEVAEIFEFAAEAQHTSQPQLPSNEGMTLSQLQEIGREVGLSPELIDQASKAVGLSVRETSREFLGFPIGVGLSADLARNLSDAEWDRVVADLRETFDARGKVATEGQLRHWSNGNLQAHLEPTATGQRIRLRTRKGDAQALIVGGIAMMTFAALAAVASLVRGPLDDTGMIAALFTLATGGAAMFGFGALPLRRWAHLRKQQMEAVTARVAALANSSKGPPGLNP